MCTYTDNRDDKRKIGVLGGTFDPVHIAHVALGEAAVREANLSKLIIMPAKVQPFKQGKKMAEDFHRHAMAKLAFQNTDKAEVSDYEMNKNSISYTVDTLRYIREEYPESEIFFIAGTDSFIFMDTWYKGKEILGEFSVAVAIRPGYREEELNEKIKEYKDLYDTNIVKVKSTMPPLSATEIRKRLGEDESISELVPPQVERYIEENGLYK